MEDSSKKGAGTGAVGGAAVGGVAGGATAGALAGGVTGPAGAAIGAAVGAGVGAMSGKKAGDVSASGQDSGRLHTVIGAFDDGATAQRAVERLVSAGFDRHDVHLQHEQAASTQRQVPQPDSGRKSGGFFASLFGLDEDDGGSTQQQRGYSERAYTYDEAVRRGSAVVAVDARGEDEADRASALLHELGAVDVDERSKQWRAEGWQPGSGAARPAVGGKQEQVLDVVEEELQVGKRTFDRGGVRVVQRVSSKPIREVVHLREERAVVERTPVNREASAADLANFREGTLEVRETVEEPVVAKKARVVEEVRVGKEVRERDETIEDSVRRKDVDVERLAGNDSRERAVAADPRQPLSQRERDERDSGKDVTGKPRKDA